MKHLIEQITDNEFKSIRSYLSSKEDRNPFISANILLILQNCNRIPDEFKEELEKVKKHLSSYQNEHLTYHWPLKNGRSRIANASKFGLLSYLSISPDADCSTLQLMALQQTEYIDALCKELEFYRVDNTNFRLARFQQVIPKYEATFLTWFPPREKSHSRKLESIDLAVNANILLFLARSHKLHIRGAKETIESLKATLKTNLILEETFRVSPYYPKPVLILYLISRAIDWGDINELKSCKDDILGLLRKVPKAKNSFDCLLYASIYNHLKDLERAQFYVSQYETLKKQTAYYYVYPFLSAFALRFSAFTFFAKSPLSHIRFKSIALEYALKYYLDDCLNKKQCL